MKAFSAMLSLSLIFLVLAATPQPTTQENNKRAQLAGLDITMSLVKYDDQTQQKEWPSESISLVSESVPVNGKTIGELLNEAHIFDDVEAIGVVYALNPQIRELNRLNISQLRIPKAQEGQNLESAFKEGFVVRLTVDKELKEQFNERVMRLGKLVQDFENLGTKRYKEPRTREFTIKSLKNISETLQRINERIIQRAGTPIPTEALKQLSGEAKLLNELLSSLTSSSKPRLGKAEQRQITAIEKDIEIKKRSFKEVAGLEPPSRWGEVNVIVRTLKRGREVHGLRIYYVAEALRNQNEEVRSFSKLSSPSDQLLPSASYIFWAVRDSDPQRKPITNEQPRDVYQQAEIQLTVLH